MGTITVDLTIAVNGGTPLTHQTMLTAEAPLGPIAIPIPAESANLEISPLAIDVSQLKLFELVATTDMTVYTNDEHDGSPGDTLPLVANKPLLWFEACGLDNPLTVDVTKLYVTSVAAGTLTITLGQDITP